MSYEKDRDEALDTRISKPEVYGDIGPICYPWIIGAAKDMSDWSRDWHKKEIDKNRSVWQEKWEKHNQRQGDNMQKMSDKMHEQSQIIADLMLGLEDIKKHNESKYGVWCTHTKAQQLLSSAKEKLK